MGQGQGRDRMGHLGCASQEPSAPWPLLLPLWSSSAAHALMHFMLICTPLFFFLIVLSSSQLKDLGSRYKYIYLVPVWK